MGHSIAKNTAFMTAASVLQKVISFAYFTLVARSIGVEGTGQYFFALSCTTVFVVFVDLGLTNVMVREIAKAEDRAEEYVRTVLGMKIMLGAVTYLALIGTMIFLDYPSETRNLVYLSGVTMLFDSLHLTLYGVLRSLGNLAYEAVSITGSQLLTLVLGTIFLYLHLPIIFLILAFTISSAANVCFIGLILFRTHRFRLTPSFSSPIRRHFLRLAAPFALAAIFARVYSYSDTLILSRLAGNTAVGWYSIPYKITYAFQFVPLALTAAIYPRMSEYYARDRSRLALVLQQSLVYLLAIVAPITVGIFMLASDIILMLYTADYLPAIMPLKILIVGLIFSYVSFPLGACLNACDRQKTQTTIIGIVMGINIFLNILLIPKIGIRGAAIAALVGNFLLFAIGVVVVARIVAMPLRFFVFSIAKIFAAAFSLGIVVWVARANVHILATIALGAFVYIAMLFLTRVITREHINAFRFLLIRHVA